MTVRPKVGNESPRSFFRSFLFALSPQSKRLEQATSPEIVLKTYKGFMHLPRFLGFNRPGLLQTPKILIRYHLHFNRLAPLSFHLTITAITVTKSTLSPEVATTPVQPPMYVVRSLGKVEAVGPVT